MGQRNEAFYVETVFRSAFWQFSTVRIFGSLTIRVFVASGQTVILDKNIKIKNGTNAYCKIKNYY